MTVNVIAGSSVIQDIIQISVSKQYVIVPVLTHLFGEGFFGQSSVKALALKCLGHAFEQSLGATARACSLLLPYTHQRQFRRQNTKDVQNIHI